MNPVEEFTALYEKAKQTPDAEGFAALFDCASFMNDEENRELVLSALPSHTKDVAFPYISGVMESLLTENPNTREFYKRLWAAIFDNSFLTTEPYQRAALFFSLTNGLLPFEHLELVSMDDEEYAQRIEVLSDKVFRIIQLAHRPFSQKTESASALLNTIKSVDDPADQAILMATALDVSRAQSQQN